MEVLMETKKPQVPTPCCRGGLEIRGCLYPRWRHLAHQSAPLAAADPLQPVRVCTRTSATLQTPAVQACCIQICHSG